MTEQEIKLKISDSETQIKVSYQKLTGSARSMATKSSQAIVAAKENAIIKANERIVSSTFFPLLLTALGVLLIFINFVKLWFLIIILIIAGIVLSGKLREKANDKKSEVERYYNDALAAVNSQKARLDNVLNDHQNI